MSLIDKMIWQMEMRLADPVTLEELAAACAVSPYHLARSFRLATAMSPMTYLRARRLSVAAQALSGGADILTVAIDAQYNSQAAFTRAFTRYFGCPPGSLRKRRSLETFKLMEPLKMQQDMIVDLPPHDIRSRNAMRVTGLGVNCKVGDNSRIPPLWQSLNARMDEFPQSALSGAFGVCTAMDGSGGFRYIAGFAGAEDVPDGMEQVALPAGKYAVFTHKGHIADFPNFVYTVWNKALPDAGLEPREAPEFELYDHRFDIATGRGTVELWVPVKDG